MVDRNPPKASKSNLPVDLPCVKEGGADKATRAAAIDVGQTGRKLLHFPETDRQDDRQTLFHYGDAEQLK